MQVQLRVHLAIHLSSELLTHYCRQADLLAEAQVTVPEPDTHQPWPDTNSPYRTHRLGNVTYSFRPLPRFG